MHTSNPTLRSVLGEKLAPNYMAAYKDTLRIGTDFELRTQSFFASQGYFVVRSAESRGPADLVCLRLDEILLIQCKGGVGRIHDAERIRLIKVAEMIHAKAMLAQEGGDGAVLLTELKH
jgi:Holliday junction resolvase